MLELGPFVAPYQDVIRLVVVPALLFAAYQDVRTRRVTPRIWPVLLLVAVIALALEGYDAYTAGGLIWREFVLVTGLSVGVLVPLAYGFWYLGGFGGADAKAIMVLSVLFPTVPRYELAEWVLPISEFAANVFSLSILTNAVLLGLLYPATLAVINLWHGFIGWHMFIGRQVAVDRLERLTGRLIETSSGRRQRGLDLDALRMYLRWRGCTLEEVRQDSERFRTTVPTDPDPPGDGAVTDGGRPEDPWAAAAFLADTPYSAYGTTPELLRESLDLLVTRDRVWYTPGIPFILLMFAGVIVALTYGDLLGTVMIALGLA